MHNPGAFVFARNASVYLHPHLLTKKEGIMVYSIAAIMIDPQKGAGEYEGYIRRVKPVVERYGGRYLLRSEKITPLTSRWEPDRMIVIEWDSREQLELCFNSSAYRKIAGMRENSVDSRAVIVEG